MAVNVLEQHVFPVLQCIFKLNTVYFLLSSSIKDMTYAYVSQVYKRPFTERVTNTPDPQTLLPDSINVHDDHIAHIMECAECKYKLYRYFANSELKQIVDLLYYIIYGIIALCILILAR